MSSVVEVTVVLIDRAKSKGLPVEIAALRVSGQCSDRSGTLAVQRQTTLQEIFDAVSLATTVTAC